MNNILEEMLLIEDMTPMDYVNFTLKYITYLSEQKHMSKEIVFENLCVKIAVMLQYDSVINNNIVNYDAINYDENYE